jgi:hypothetical protein
MRSPVRRTLTVLFAIATLGLLSVPVALAEAGPHWQFSVTPNPTNIPPGGEGEIDILAWNLGGGVPESQSTPVTITDQLPPNLIAKHIEATTNMGGVTLEFSTECALTPVPKCTWSKTTTPVVEPLTPYGSIEVQLKVQATGGPQTTSDEAHIEGGGAPAVTVKRPVTVSEASAPFRIEGFSVEPEEADGSLDTQAGSHPYQLTTTVGLSTTYEQGTDKPVTMARNVAVNLPPGVVGNAQAEPQCSLVDFETVDDAGTSFVNLCPADTALGVVLVTIRNQVFSIRGPETLEEPLFNLVPARGEPARLGFIASVVPIVFDTAVRTGSDYGVTVSSANIPTNIEFLANRVVVWGDPGDPSHDSTRGWGCLDSGPYAPGREGRVPCLPSEAAGEPYLTMPTSCAGPLQASAEGVSWASEHKAAETAEPVHQTLSDSSGQPIALSGCGRLPFAPSMSVAPDSQAGSSPSGLTVGIHVPQEISLNPTGLAVADVKNTAVTLPAGIQLNPAAGTDLQGCSEAQVGFTGVNPQSGADEFSDSAPSCPDAAKIATASIKSPFLPNELKGAVYLAAPQNFPGGLQENPFGSLVAMYLVAEDPVSGVLIKLAGRVPLDPVTGQQTATFENTPQLPFEDLSLHFYGGARAPLSTPALCGAYTTMASIEPWSGTEPATPFSTFAITSGPGGASCADPLPFAPSLTAGSTNIQAGAFTAFTTTMTREDGNQNLRSIVLHMPPGLSGDLTGVALCGETQADAGTCGSGSLIGQTTVSVGLGSEPFTVNGGQVFLTGPYKGAPFGLSIVNPAVAGPFNLGKVVVRAKVEVDPHTAALTITTDPSGPYAIPQMIQGIPLQIKHVNVTVDRSGFTFNPTNCQPLKITGTLGSSEGVSAPLTVPFQATNCATLKFAPKFAVSTSGKTSRANGASLTARLTYPAGAQGTQANIASVKVSLPKQLPSRLKTLQQACAAAQFETNPAGCPAASIVGHAKAVTPIVPVPLEGPAYFVSHGGEAFPSLIVVLQGYGVTVDLVGTTFISKAGITSNTFKTVPDVPVGSFELTLPEGKYSALAANGNLCKAKLTMPTLFVAQNGAELKQATKITPTGCPKARKAKKATKRKRHKGARKGAAGRRRQR